MYPNYGTSEILVSVSTVKLITYVQCRVYLKGNFCLEEYD